MHEMKALVVDDTIFYRKIVSDILNSFPNVQVVGTANNGEIALSRIKLLQPDFLTLDVEMPGMNGLQLLEQIRERDLNVECIMLSSKTQEGSEATVRALELGAFDFIAKPDETSADANQQYISKALAVILRALARRLETKKKFGRRPVMATPMVRLKTAPSVPAKRLKRLEKSQVVAIAISTGGPSALAAMLPLLPQDIGVPVLIVQHMPPLFSASLAKSLDKKCPLAVKEAVNGEKVLTNTVYIAPGGKMMKVASGVDYEKIIRITDDPPENNCKPAADYLFRSVSREYGSKSTCVVMTGMGVDGKLGIAVAKAGGAVAIAQDEATCVVYGMPKVVVEAGLADVVAPLEQIAQKILDTL